VSSVNLPHQGSTTLFYHSRMNPGQRILCDWNNGRA
jgi:hypothetical protein